MTCLADAIKKVIGGKWPRENRFPCFPSQSSSDWWVNKSNSS